MISARSGDHGGPAAKHRFYQRQRQPFTARNQNVQMVIPPYFSEVALVTTKPHAIFQAKVPDHIEYVSCVRPAAEKIESPVTLLPLGSGQRLNHAILAFTKYFISANCRESHLL